MEGGVSVSTYYYEQQEDVSDSQSFEPPSSGPLHYTANASATSLPGLSGSGNLIGDIAGPKIGLSGATTVKAGAGIDGAGNGYVNVDGVFVDPIWFYSTAVPYGTTLDVHLQAIVHGDLIAQTASQGSYAEGSADFKFSLDNWRLDETPMDEFRIDVTSTNGVNQRSVTGDRVLDIDTMVSNTPNFRFDLKMEAIFAGYVSVGSHADQTVDGFGKIDFQFGNTFAWNALISATTLDGKPVDLVIGSQYENDYSHSYVTPDTTNAVPEPSTYGLLGAAVLFGVGMLRRRWCVKS